MLGLQPGQASQQTGACLKGLRPKEGGCEEGEEQTEGSNRWDFFGHQPCSPHSIGPTYFQREASQGQLPSRPFSPVSRHCDQVTTVVGELHASDNFCKQSREASLLF